MTAAALTWDWPASSVTRVIDGDSFVARVTRDLGFHGTASFEVKMRLDGINASPGKTEQGKQATARATQLLTAGPVHIVTTGPYKYGDEWMAIVTVPTTAGLDIDVAKQLVAEGLALPWDGTGPRPGG